MGINHLWVLLGITTAVVAAPFSVQAANLTGQIASGTTSVNLDLDLLKSVGLTLKSASGTVTPASGFQVGFDILPPSGDSNILGSGFTFSYDDATKEFTPLSGTIEHSGSVLFDVDTTKLAVFSPLELGNFSIGYDGGFSITDKFSTGLPLFDLALTSPPTFDGKNFQLANAELRVSQAFSDILDNYSGTNSTKGLKVGTAQIDARTVPEPGSVVAILTAASLALGVGKRRKIV